LQFLSVFAPKRRYLKLKDTVNNYDGKDPNEDLQTLRKIAEQFEPKISRNLSRRRYLEELKAWEANIGKEKWCVICQSGFEIGALTKCGHLFCFSCLQIWLKDHRSCPVCKERLTRDEWHKIATQRGDVVIRQTEFTHHDHTFSQAIYEA
jgi:E3 ubiquitin-protein ligase SHPRH